MGRMIPAGTTRPRMDDVRSARHGVPGVTSAGAGKRFNQSSVRSPGLDNPSRASKEPEAEDRGKPLGDIVDRHHANGPPVLVHEGHGATTHARHAIHRIKVARYDRQNARAPLAFARQMK